MSNLSPTKLVVICRSSPYASARISAAFDFILTAATFDQDVRVLFIGEGLYNLLPDQKAEDYGVKNSSKSLPAFDLYGVREILVDKNDALPFNPEDFVVPVSANSNIEIKALLKAADQVFVF